MAWTTPRTWVTGELVTASIMNAHVRDNLSFIDARMLGYAEVTADQGSITSEADLTDLSVTATVGTSRRVRVTGRIGVTVNAVSDTTATLRIKESTTVLNLCRLRCTTASREETMIAQWVGAPSAASHTYKLSLEREVGTGTLNMEAGSVTPAFILLEDIGAA